MSTPESGAAPPPGRILSALMAAVAYIALVVMVWGIMSFTMSRDVIVDADAGPLLGPTIVLACAGLVLAICIRRRRLAPIGAGVTAILGSIMIAAFLAGVVLVFGSGRLLAFPVYFGSYIINPFILVAGALAGGVSAGATALPRGS